jgi:autotransporter-associated beta strand protein
LTIYSGNGSVAIDGAISNLSGLEINTKSASSLLAGIVSGPAALSLNSATGYSGVNSPNAVLTLSAANSYTGTTAVNGGKLRVTGSLNDSNAVTVSSGATYEVATNDTIASLAGAGNVILSSDTFTLGGTADATYSGVMSGTGSLVKTGAGTLTLSGMNTYTGDTTINAGTLILTGSLSSSTDVVMTNAAIWDLQASQTVASLTMASGNSITRTAGTSSLVVSGTSTLANSITTSGVQTYTGAVTLLADTALTTTNSAIGFTSTLDSNNVAAYALTTSTGTSSTTFGAAVGATHALASLSTSGNASIGGNVTTVGTQNFGGIATVESALTLQTTNANVTFSGNLVLNASITVNAGSADIYALGNVTSNTSLSSGSAAYQSAVLSSSPLL